MKKVLFLVLALLPFSCSSDDPKENSDSKSFVNTAFKWPNPKRVQVCIMNKDEVSDEILSDVKSHVTNDYSSKAGINFVGWEKCESRDKTSSDFIRISFRRLHNWKATDKITAGAGESLIGRGSASCHNDCRGGTMRLDIGLEGKYPSPSTWQRNFAVQQTRATAVHEFGHAMGLLHEHERTDAPGCGDYTTEVKSSDYQVYVGKFDPNSIMNYCHNKDLTTLSPGDVNGLKYLYPQLGKADALASNPATPSAPASDASRDLEFGPFTHNENRVLATLPAAAGTKVSFALTVDLENEADCAYDHVYAEDAGGWKSSRVCGKKTWYLNNLRTPVRILFRSDAGVASKSVKVTGIKYSGSASTSDMEREQVTSSPD